MLNWNKFILTHKFESSFSQFILLSVCTFLDIVQLQENIQKCTLAKVVRRVLQLFLKIVRGVVYQWYWKPPWAFPVPLQQNITKDVNLLQQLGTAVSHLPTHNPYSYRNSAMLLHLQVTALKEEYRSDDSASSSSSSDDNTSSPFLPLRQTWIYRTSDQPLPRLMHVTVTKLPLTTYIDGSRAVVV